MRDLPFSIYVQIISDHEKSFQTVCIPIVLKALLIKTKITWGLKRGDGGEKVEMPVLPGSVKHKAGNPPPPNHSISFMTKRKELYRVFSGVCYRKKKNSHQELSSRQNQGC